MLEQPEERKQLMEMYNLVFRRDIGWSHKYRKCHRESIRRFRDSSKKIALLFKKVLNSFNAKKYTPPNEYKQMYRLYYDYLDVYYQAELLNPRGHKDEETVKKYFRMIDKTMDTATYILKNIVIEKKPQVRVPFNG